MRRPSGLVAVNDSRSTARARDRSFIDTQSIGASTAPSNSSGGFLGRRLRRLDLHKEPALLETVADLTFELFDLV